MGARGPTPKGNRCVGVDAARDLGLGSPIAKLRARVVMSGREVTGLGRRARRYLVSRRRCRVRGAHAPGLRAGLLDCEERERESSPVRCTRRRALRSCWPRPCVGVLAHAREGARADGAPLQSREVSAYGLARPGGPGERRRAAVACVAVLMSVAAAAPSIIVTSRGPDGVPSRWPVPTSIAGAQAPPLQRVRSSPKWDGVDYLLLQGWSIDGTRVVREKITNAT